MKKAIIILCSVNGMHAMYYDDAVTKTATVNYIKGASYFTIHRPGTCEKYWVKSTYYVTAHCPEHANPYATCYNYEMVNALNKGAGAVIFYGRNDQQVGQMELLHGYIGSMACDQLRNKLDPNAKPIVTHASVENEWCCPSISFFNHMNQFVFKMPLYGYFDGEHMSDSDKMCALEQVALGANFSIEDKRDKKSCYRCCLLV